MYLNDARSTANENLGARVLDSLLVGRPFVAAFVGDSVVSGHDNQFISTHPIQLQSRLRKFWVDNGVKGSAFTVRNVAEGGGLDQWTQSGSVLDMATENFDLFDPLNTDNDPTIIKQIDLISWSFWFTDGKANIELRENAVRIAAALNAIWGIHDKFNGMTEYRACKNESIYAVDSFLNRPWDHKIKYQINQVGKPYVDKMGIFRMNPDRGAQLICPILSGNITHIDARRPKDDGDPPEGFQWGFGSDWVGVNWHPNPIGHRIASDGFSYWILNSAREFLIKYKDELTTYLTKKTELKWFLKRKSGDWSKNILDSIKNKDDNLFVKPVFCGRNGGGYCNTIPFELTGLNPKIFNTHHYLPDYLIYPNSIDKLDDVKWTFGSQDSVIPFDYKTGGPGPCDTKVFFLPDAGFHTSKAREYKHDFKEFEKYLIDNKYYIQFAIKVPKYGDTIRVVYGYRCQERGQDYFHYYLSELNDDNIGTLSNDTFCGWNGLKSDKKYKITVVAYDTTKKKWPYGIFFFSGH